METVYGAIMITRYKKNQIFLETVCDILRDLGRKLEFNTIVLDFGCGKGEMVDLLVQQGYYFAFGVDISNERIEYARNYLLCGNPERFRTIKMQPYSLPVENESVDFILSSQVIEHVKDIDSCFSELARIMRPDAISINIFPSKYRILETHTHVPLGNIIKVFWWHLIWVCLGFRQKSTERSSVSECANSHLAYIRQNTFYRRQREIVSAAQRNGLKANFLNGLKYSTRFNSLKLLHHFPLTRIGYSIFISKVLILQPIEK